MVPAIVLVTAMLLVVSQASLANAASVAQVSLLYRGINQADNSTADHLASDCTEKRVRACRNCDSTEHEAKECNQPKDWSRVTCKNCGEKGHGVKRCKKPIVENQEDGDGYDRDNGADGAAASVDTGGW